MSGNKKGWVKESTVSTSSLPYNLHLLQLQAPRSHSTSHRGYTARVSLYSCIQIQSRLSGFEVETPIDRRELRQVIGERGGVSSGGRGTNMSLIRAAVSQSPCTPPKRGSLSVSSPLRPPGPGFRTKSDWSVSSRQPSNLWLRRSSSSMEEVSCFCLLSWIVSWDDVSSSGL